MSQAEAAPRELELDEADVYDEFVRRGWCDGLPIVPPTPERVQAMLATVSADPARSLGLMPPLWRECTAEKIAVNAVMAGCLPEYFPVVLAATRALLEPAFNLYGVQATTHPVAPLLVLNGPLAERIGLHCGVGVLRARLSRQRHHRPRHSPRAHERGRRLAGPPRHGHPGQPRQVLVRGRGGGRRQPVGPAAREPWLQPRSRAW